MMDDAEVKALLDGATPGPWRADGEPWNRVVWSSADNRVCFMAHSNGLDDERDIATSNLAAAAPTLARSLLAAHAEIYRLRADAQAAVAMVVERAVKEGMRIAASVPIEQAQQAIDTAIRALADTDGLALVKAAVETERDRIIAALNNEADLCPCSEDAVVIRDCAKLIKADFSYDDAEAAAHRKDEETPK